MTSRWLATVVGVLEICQGTLSAQESKPALQERLMEIKKSLAESQARLKAYQWVETTEVSLKGEVKKQEQKECRYTPDGQLVKTSLGAPPEPHAEVFHDWRYNTFHRQRYGAGAEFEVNEHFVVEVYYLRQQDSHSSVRGLNVGGLALQFYLP